jgi:hypothetical protein
MNLQLEYPSFIKCKQAGSLIGFISFKVGRDWSWYNLGVHLLRIPKGNVKIRLVYPERQAPPTREMQEEIDSEVNSYILAQYPEVLK